MWKKGWKIAGERTIDKEEEGKGRDTREMSVKIRKIRGERTVLSCGWF